jgi:NB-ARC domain
MLKEATGIVSCLGVAVAVGALALGQGSALVAGGFATGIAVNFGHELCKRFHQRASAFAEKFWGLDQNEHIRQGVRRAQIAATREVLRAWRTEFPPIGALEDDGRRSLVSLLTSWCDEQGNASVIERWAHIRRDKDAVDEFAPLRKAFETAFGAEVDERSAMADRALQARHLAMNQAFHDAIEGALSYAQFERAASLRKSAGLESFKSAFFGESGSGGWFEPFMLAIGKEFKANAEFKRLWDSVQIGGISAMLLDDIELSSERHAQLVQIVQHQSGLLELSVAAVKADTEALLTGQGELKQGTSAARADIARVEAGQQRDRETFAEFFEYVRQGDILGRATARDISETALSAAGAPSPEEEQRPLHLIGREKLIDEIVDGLMRDGQHRALLYLPGVGKTSVAQAIIRNDKLKGYFQQILWIDIGNETSLEKAMRELATNLKIPESETSELVIPSDFRPILIKYIANRRLLIILDDIWNMDDVRLFENLGRNCTYIMTTRSKIIASALNDMTSIEVEPLDEKHSKALLEKKAPEAITFIENHDEFKGYLDRIIKNIGGLPIALEVVGEYLRKSFADDSYSLLDALKSIEEAGALVGDNSGDDEIEKIKERVRPFFDLPLASLSDDDREAFLSLSIFKHEPGYFTEDMAQSICEVYIGGKNAKHTAIKRTGLLKLRNSERNRHTYYSIHRLIAEYAYRKLSKAKRISLHQCAAKYYEDEIEKRWGHETLSYASWYRYESTDWQGLQEERLYHLAHADETAQAVANAILRIFLDAFWWWGYYQPFAFCQALVNHWQHRISSESVKRILANLTAFRENYPAGDNRAKRGAPGWSRVRECLLALVEEAGLGGEAKNLDDDKRHIRGMIDFFLAESYEYEDVTNLPEASDLAAQFYHASLSAFVDLHDDWNASWMMFYFAESIASHRKTSAIEKCKESIELAEKVTVFERDPEILGNLYRLLGDMSIEEFRFDDAARSYQKASFYAYGFQGIPNPPDSYTIAFYREITEKIGDRICDLWSKNPDAGQHLFDSLSTYWEPYWKISNFVGRTTPDNSIFSHWERVVEHLFPPPPSEEIVQADGTTFKIEVRKVLGLLSGIESSPRG